MEDSRGQSKDAELRTDTQNDDTANANAEVSTPVKRRYSDSNEDPAHMIKPETTGALRQRLGFTDDNIWKKLSSRRLEFIHSMGLNLRVASEQEKAIAAVAQQLALEFGYPESALPDFEKLVRVGVQSVRRNQRRPVKFKHHQEDKRVTRLPVPATQGSAVPQQHQLQPQQASTSFPLFTNAAAPSAAQLQPNNTTPPQLALGSLANTLSSPPITSSATPNPNPALGALSALIQDSAHHGEGIGEAQSYASIIRVLCELRSTVTLSNIAIANTTPPSADYLSMVGEGLLRTAAGLVGISTNEQHQFVKSVLASIEHGVMSQLLLQALYSPGSQQLTASNSTLVCAIGLAANHDLNRTLFHTRNLFSLLFSNGAQTNALPSLDNAAKTLAQAVSQMSAVQAPLPAPAPAPAPASAVDRPPTRGLPAALLAQQNVSSILPVIHAPPIQHEQPALKMARMSPNIDSHHHQQASDSAEGLWEPRRVTIRHENNAFELNYSPLKNTPPTLTEITDNSRIMFHVPPNIIMRFRDSNRGIIIDSDADLAECFQAQTIHLELLLPPPPLHTLAASTQLPPLPAIKAKSPPAFLPPLEQKDTTPATPAPSVPAVASTTRIQPKFASVVPNVRYSC